MTPLSYLLLAICAAATFCSVSAGSDHDTAHASLLADLKDSSKWNSIAPGMGQFRRVLEVAGSLEEVARLIEARQVSAKNCTVEHQQWLISQLIKSKGMQLHGYLKEIRDQYRKLCAESFKQRLTLQMIDLDQDDVDTVGALTVHLPETKKFKENIYKLDTLPLDSLVDAIKAYLPHPLNNYHDDYDRPAREALNELEGACKHITKRLYDFLWTLKLIDRPVELGSILESLLWKTKVCAALKLDQFDAELRSRYLQLDVSERELLAKFTNLLRLSNDILDDADYELERDQIKQALGQLADERHFQSRDADELDAANGLLEDLDRACEAVLKKMSPLLWLVDFELAELSSPSSISVFKQARVCALMPFKSRH